MPRAFITGCHWTGRPAPRRFLHSKGYEIFGMVKGQNNPRMTMMRDEFPYSSPSRRPGGSAVTGQGAGLDAAHRGLQPRRDLLRGASFNQAELTANIPAPAC